MVLWGICVVCMRNSCPRYASGVGTDEKYYKKTTAPSSHARKRPHLKEGRKGRQKGHAAKAMLSFGTSRTIFRGAMSMASVGSATFLARLTGKGGSFLVLGPRHLIARSR